MSQIGQCKDENICVQELNDLPSQAQAECIADRFAEISNLYQPLNLEDVDIPDETKPAPLFEPLHIHKKIKSMKKKTSTIFGDIPWKIISEFSVELSQPLANIFNTATLEGIWPKSWKVEYVTPVPKVYPPEKIDDLRKIATTKNLSKIYEALLSDYITEDMSPHIDRAQFGNQKGLSTTHYLIQMLNKILTLLDTKNKDEKMAVIALLVDWNKAFDRQDPLLGIRAFIKNGVRPSLIPILASFFQNRRMSVKWHGYLSGFREMPGGGPQGCIFALLEYLANSNDNAAHIPIDMRFKFIDDLTALELINLLLAGLSSYDCKNHVPSDIGVNQKFLAAENTKSQAYLNQIHSWTQTNFMKLNAEKTKVMVFNFSHENQFSTRLQLEGKLLDTIDETKLLGTIITSNLKWRKNTEFLAKRAYKRMIILQN